MELKIKKIIIDQFKGETHAEYDFTDRTLITGRNGSGKTTIADAYFWLMTDRDAGLKSNPDIRPDFMAESEPSVTIICDIGGKEVTLRKYQKDSRNKKQKEEGAPVRISNQYEINAVPKSQKDFSSFLSDCGIVVDNILLLSHPDVFTSQKSADCRQILFGMVSDLTDKDIAEQLPGCESVRAMLESYTAAEITAMQKRTKKEADERIEAIPNQIIGLEKAKVDIDVAEFEHQKAGLQSQIDAMERAIEENPIPSLGELNQTLVALENQQKQLVAEANAERVKKLSEIDAEIGEMKVQLSIKESKKTVAIDNLTDYMGRKNELERKHKALEAQFYEIKASEYEIGDTTCPYCGQDLPVHKLDDAKKQFDEDKAKRLDAINEDAAVIRKKVLALVREIKSVNQEVADLDAEITSLKESITEKCALREPFETAVDISGSAEQTKIMQEVINIRRQIAQRDNAVTEEGKLRAQIAEHIGAIKHIDNLLAQAQNNERIDAQIAELKTQQKEYAQAKADAENILYQLQQISMAKNNLLEEQVNSHFRRVKFRLFITQKNGEIKDDCTPMVLTSNGEYRDMTFSANTAAIELAKLDIINGLQEFYAQRLPVFADGFECLDRNNKAQIDIGTQLIMLCVSDDDLKVEGM